MGDRFTLADLTGAAMLAPLIGPDASPWCAQRLGLPPSEERNMARERAAGQWVLSIYARYRRGCEAG